jgi:hypothetical protein
MYYSVGMKFRNKISFGMIYQHIPAHLEDTSYRVEITGIVATA